MNGGVDLGVKVEEGGNVSLKLENVSLKLGNARQVADPGGDELADQWKSGPVG